MTNQRLASFPDGKKFAFFIFDVGVPLLEGYKLFRLEGLWFWHSLRSRRKRPNYEVTETPYLRREISGRAVRSEHGKDG